MNMIATRKEHSLKDNEDPVVYFSNRESSCEQCGKELDRGDRIVLSQTRCTYCLKCAGLDHLQYLPSGDTSLTRRAKKHSTLSAVVLKFSKARKRSERQGLLVEKDALEQARIECASDAEQRAAKRERDRVRREKEDRKYIKRFAERVRELYPYCPLGQEYEIADHACSKHSGRVGRSASAKELDECAVSLAVRAHIRHQETEYDGLLAEGVDREMARVIVSEEINRTASKWWSGKKEVAS